MYQSFLRRKGGAGFLDCRPCGTHRPPRVPPQPFGLLSSMPSILAGCCTQPEPRQPGANCFVQHWPTGCQMAGERGQPTLGAPGLLGRPNPGGIGPGRSGEGGACRQPEVKLPIPLPFLRRKGPCSPISPAYKRGQKIPQNLQNEARHPCIRWAILQSRQRTIYWRLHMKGE